MGPEHFWGGGTIFPIFMPLMMLVFLLVVVYLFCWRGGFRPPRRHGPEISSGSEDWGTAMEILKKRYAKGEITREEFQQMKKDLHD